MGAIINTIPVAVEVGLENIQASAPHLALLLPIDYINDLLACLSASLKSGIGTYMSTLRYVYEKAYRWFCSYLETPNEDRYAICEGVEKPVVKDGEGSDIFWDTVLQLYQDFLACSGFIQSYLYNLQVKEYGISFNIYTSIFGKQLFVERLKSESMFLCSRRS